MEIIHLPKSWQCTRHIEEDNDEPFTGSIEKAFSIVYPTTTPVPHIRRPVWDLSSSRHHHEEQGGNDDDDDYAWYYNHPERYIWRPRRNRLSTHSRRQKDKPFTLFDLLPNNRRDSWTDTSISGTQDSMYSETWSLLSSSTGSTKVSEVRFLKD